MICKGQRVTYKPEWMEPGEERFVFLAASDESKGRVDVVALVPGWTFQPWTTVSVDMIASAEWPSDEVKALWEAHATR